MSSLWGLLVQAGVGADWSRELEGGGKWVQWSVAGVQCGCRVQWCRVRAGVLRCGAVRRSSVGPQLWREEERSSGEEKTGQGTQDTADKRGGVQDTGHRTQANFHNTEDTAVDRGHSTQGQDRVLSHMASHPSSGSGRGRSLPPRLGHDLSLQSPATSGQDGCCL